MENSPFQLLLGRPWQVDNLVTIDEDLKGTTLIFKNLEGKPIYKLFLKNSNNFIPFKKQPASYLMRANDKSSSEDEDSFDNRSLVSKNHIPKETITQKVVKKGKEKHKLISKANGCAKKAYERLQQADDYMFNKNQYPKFSFRESDVKEVDQLVSYLLITDGTLEGFMEVLPDKYKGLQQPIHHRAMTKDCVAETRFDANKRPKPLREILLERTRLSPQ
jgi:hypothetical protein